MLSVSPWTLGILQMGSYNFLNATLVSALLLSPQIINVCCLLSNLLPIANTHSSHTPSAIHVSRPSLHIYAPRHQLSSWTSRKCPQQNRYPYSTNYNSFLRRIILKTSCVYLCLLCQGITLTVLAAGWNADHNKVAGDLLTAWQHFVIEIRGFNTPIILVFLLSTQFNVGHLLRYHTFSKPSCVV
jgi:hypothetical protein